VIYPQLALGDSIPCGSADLTHVSVVANPEHGDDGSPQGFWWGRASVSIDGDVTLTVTGGVGIGFLWPCIEVQGGANNLQQVIGEMSFDGFGLGIASGGQWSDRRGCGAPPWEQPPIRFTFGVPAVYHYSALEDAHIYTKSEYEARPVYADAFLRGFEFFTSGGTRFQYDLKDAGAPPSPEVPEPSTACLTVGALLVFLGFGWRRAMLLQR
jgi:hypothetical protein